MKSLDKINKIFSEETFDLDFESQMVQSRIVSTLLEVIESKNLKQKDLEELTGLSQPFISALFHNRKKLNVEHIALFQNALDIVLLPPSYMEANDHKIKYYSENDFCENDIIKSFDNIKILHYSFNTVINHYTDDFLRDELREIPSIRNKENKVFDYA